MHVWQFFGLIMVAALARPTRGQPQPTQLDAVVSQKRAAPSEHPNNAQQWPFNQIQVPIDFKGSYYGQGCRLQIVFKKDLLDRTLSYSVSALHQGSTERMLVAETAKPGTQLSYVSPTANVGPRGAYKLKGSGSTEADKKYAGYGLQPMEFASVCDNAQKPQSFRIHAKRQNQEWISEPFTVTSLTPPAPVESVRAGRSVPTATSAYVYWDDVKGTGPKPQGSFVIYANDSMLAKGLVESVFVPSVNYTDISVGSERVHLTVVRFNQDGNGALSPILDSPLAMA